MSNGLNPGAESAHDNLGENRACLPGGHCGGIWQHPEEVEGKTMKILSGTLAAGGCALLALSVSPAFGDSDVSHNWNSENEAEAMRIFRDKYIELGGEWSDTAFPDSEASIASVKARFIGGNPPMALQSALGGVMRDFAEAGLLQNMDEAAEAGGWADNISDSIAAVGRYGGHWVAAPVFVDVINWMYTNNDVLDAAGVAQPDTWDDFTASLPALQEAGVVPIAIGGDSWQEAILFDHVVLAVGGAELYENLMTGDAATVAGEQTRRVLEEFAGLRQYTDEGKSGRSWNDTNTLMITGQAAFFFMGPWAAGGYGDLGPEGGSWSCRLTPWDASLTVVADGFQFIKVTDESDMAAQVLLGNAVMDPATQIAAARAKGTLPVTTVAMASDFEGCPAKAVEAMAGSTSITHWNGRSADVGNAIKDTASALWNQAIDVDAAHQQLIDKL